MRRISKSELKAKMFEYFRNAEQSGEGLIVTDYGKPVLKIIPIRENQAIGDVFADLRGKAKMSREAALESTTSEWSQD